MNGPSRTLRVRLMIVAGGALILAASAWRARSEGDDRLEMLRVQTGDRNYGTYGAASDPFPIGKRYDGTAIKVLMAREMALQNLRADLRPYGHEITHLESHGNCAAVGPKTRHGHAIGLNQLLLSSARSLGYTGTESGLKDCAVNAHFGVAHMVRCVNEGYDTPRLLGRCYVGGWRIGNRKSHYADWYANTIVGSTLKAPVPARRFVYRFAMIAHPESSR